MSADEAREELKTCFCPTNVVKVPTGFLVSNDTYRKVGVLTFR